MTTTIHEDTHPYDLGPRWTGDGWDPHRWVPRHPTVPRKLLGIVERHMRGMGA